MDDIDSLPLVEDMLAAFDEAAPAGPDLRLDASPQSPYFRLRDARSEARADERVADNDPTATETGMRHWRRVREIAAQSLLETRDIEIAAWLTESLVRSHGLLGLAAGAELIAGLATDFWNSGLHPQPDEDGMAARIAAVAGLSGEGSNGTLLQPLRRVVMFERIDGQPVSYWQFEKAEGVATLSEPERQRRVSSGVLPFADLETEARTIGREAMIALRRDAAVAAAAWQAMEETFARVVANAAPPTSRVGELLAKMLRATARYVPEQDPGVAASVVAQPTSSILATPSGERSGGTLNRDGLLREITRIAALFRVEEPNSPLGYTLEDAVRRARLPWPDLLKEMMPEAGPRLALLSGLGIRPSTD